MWENVTYPYKINKLTKSAKITPTKLPEMLVFLLSMLFLPVPLSSLDKYEFG